MASINRKNSLDKRVLVVLGAVLAAAALLCSGLSLLPDVRGIGDSLDISEHVSIDVVRADGTSVTDGGRGEWHGRRGDSIVVHVQMPEMAPYVDSYLTFSAYNCLVKMSCAGASVKADVKSGGETVDVSEYLQKRTDSGRMIGHMEFAVPVPDEAWGSEIAVEMQPQTGVTFQMFDSFSLMPGADARFAPLKGREGQFMMYGAFAVFGFLGLIAGLVGMAFRQVLLEAALGSAFMMVSSIWFFASRGFMFAVFEDVKLCALTEYFAMLAAPVALAFFMWACVEEAFHKQTCKIVGILFTVVGLLITVVELVGGIAISDLMLPFQVMLIAALGVFLALAVRNYYEEGGDLRDLIVFIGMVAALALMLLELIGNCLECIGSLPAALLAVARADFAAGALFMAYAMIAFAQLTKAQYVIGAAVRTETLEQLAKIDPMTELPTRASVIEDIGRLKPQDRYAILYFDVNGLELANTQYGHETGDRVIKLVADALRNTFEEGSFDGFYGRWGGDEFVVFLNSVEDAEEFRGDFRRRIRELNEGKNRSGLPFMIDVPVGLTFHGRNDPRTKKQCVDDAAHQMFVDKISRRVVR